MAKVIYPITWLAGQEGEAADVINEIAVEMMEHRADLLRNAPGVPKNDGQVYLMKARLFEEYATILKVICFQLEPERWNPETSGELLERAEVHNIFLPDWMKPGKTTDDKDTKETFEYAINRFENEGGRIATENWNIR